MSGSGSLLRYEGIGHVGASPEEEREDDQKAGASLLCKYTERFVIV